MDRVLRLLPAVLLAAYAAYCLASAAGDEWRPEWDSALYLLGGQSLAAGEGYAYQGQPFVLRPPGFSWLLSFAAGDEGYDLALLNRAVALCAGLAVALLYVVLRPLHGRPIALATALLAGLGAHLVGALDFVLSELPFLALLLAGVGLLHRALGVGARAPLGPDSARAAGDPAPRHAWAFALAGGLCIAGSAYLRTVGVLVAPAWVALVLWRERGRARLVGLVGLAAMVLPLVPWQLHASAVQSAAETPSEQLLLHSYATALLHVDPGNPESPRVDAAGWLRRVRRNGAAFLSDLAWTSLRLRGGPAVTLFALALAAGFVVALRRGPTLLEGFFLAQLALLLLYFTYARRLALPVAPLALLYVLLAARAAGTGLARALGKPRLATALPALAALAVLVAELSLFAHFRHPERQPVDPQRTLGHHWQNLGRLAEWVRANTEPDAVLLCNQAPSLAFLTGRRAYTYRFPRAPGLVERTGADVLVVDGPPGPGFDAAAVWRAAPERRTLEGLPAGFPLPVARLRE